MSDIAVKVSNVNKSFRLPHEQQNSIKGSLINFRRRGYEVQEALKEVSFEVNKGDFFGIVGRNGSGKSTLLKLLAGIYTPDNGSIEINGKLTPFIELGVGFNPELSGRDNVFLNGALLGFTRKEMESMYQEIVDFAELERFMDQKLKSYSSGMQVRLAFSIAIRANTDILVLDGVLAVGDSNFQKKCFDYFKQLKQQKKTILLVTHDMASVERFCTKAMLINNGSIVSVDSPLKIAKMYNQLNSALINDDSSIGEVEAGDGVVSIKNIEITNGKDKKRKLLFEPNELINVGVDIEANRHVEDISVVFKVGFQGSQPLVNSSTRMKDIQINLKSGESLHVDWKVENIFNNGTYYVSIQLLDSDRITVHHDLAEAIKIGVDDWKYPYSMIHPKTDFVVTKRNR